MVNFCIGAREISTQRFLNASAYLKEAKNGGNPLMKKRRI